MRLHPSHLHFLNLWLSDDPETPNIPNEAVNELICQLYPRVKEEMVRNAFEMAKDLIVSPVPSESYSFHLPKALKPPSPAIVDIGLFRALEELAVEKVAVKNMQALITLATRLKRLAFQYGALHDIRLLFMPEMETCIWEKLSYLDLSHNALSTFSEEGLACIPHITFLNLAHNLFNQIPLLSSLVYLRHLDMSFNMIEKTGDIFLKVK